MLAHLRNRPMQVCRCALKQGLFWIPSGSMSAQHRNTPAIERVRPVANRKVVCKVPVVRNVPFSDPIAVWAGRPSGDKASELRNPHLT